VGSGNNDNNEKMKRESCWVLQKLKKFRHREKGWIQKEAQRLPATGKGKGEMEEKRSGRKLELTGGLESSRC